MWLGRAEGSGYVYDRGSATRGKRFGVLYMMALWVLTTRNDGRLTYDDNGYAWRLAVMPLRLGNILEKEADFLPKNFRACLVGISTCNYSHVIDR